MKFLCDRSLPDRFTTEHSQDLALSTSMQFGVLREVCVADKGIRVLISDSGISFWFPESAWRAFNKQVLCYLNTPLERECWIAKKGWGFGKLDFNRDDMEPLHLKRYFNSELTAVSMSAALGFLRVNFVNNPQAYASSTSDFCMRY